MSTEPIIIKLKLIILKFDMISSLFIYFINVLIIQITGSYISLIAEWLEGLLATKTWDGERAIIVLGD